MQEHSRNRSITWKTVLGLLGRAVAGIVALVLAVVAQVDDNFFQLSFALGMLAVALVPSSKAQGLQGRWRLLSVVLLFVGAIATQTLPAGAWVP